MHKDVDYISNPKKAFWQLTAPLLLLSLFEACYSFVDVFWVSQMNAQSFFAIGLMVPLTTLITSFGKSLGVGTNSIISRQIGEGKYTDTYNSILHGVVACFILGFVIMSSTIILKNILTYMGAASTMDLSLDYIRPIFLFSFVFLFSNLFVSTLQAEGNSRTPTIILIITNILNLILDPILIFVLNWGVAGASYATIISSAVTTIYLLYYYLSGKTDVTLNFKYFKPGIVYDIFIVAIPNFLTDTLWCICTLFFNKILIQQLGQIGVLLYSTATRIQSLIVSPQKAFSKSLITVSGRLYGAEKFDELNDLYNYVLKISMIIALITTVAFFFVRNYGYALFSVTGVEDLIFYVGLGGIIIVPLSEVSVLAGRILDGMGKSYHNLILTICTIAFEIGIVILLEPIFPSGGCVLLGMIISTITFAFIYYILLKHILSSHGKNELLINVHKNN